ncbi:MAG: hypothetical protein LQ340_005886, partial [Diploschistes diacapsis]
MASNQNPPEEDEEETMLDVDEAAEEIHVDDDDDHPMESDPEDDPGASGEITLENNSIAYFSYHSDSLFAIASHPLNPTLIATGS